jgi:transposase, IS5 family
MTYIYTTTIQEQALFWDLKDLLWDAFGKSKLVHLESVIDRESKADLIQEAYSIKWRNSVSVRVMIALQILKGIRKWASDRDLVRYLQTDLEVMWFCGIRNINDASKCIDSSSLTKFRNRISSVEWLMEKLQSVHVEKVVKDTVPYRKRGQYDQDSTVIEEKIAYPNDVDLLSKVIANWVKFVNEGKKIVWKKREWVINTGKRIARKLQLAYHFGKTKWEEKILEIKKDLMKIWENRIKQMKNLVWDLEKLIARGEKKYLKIHKQFTTLIHTWTQILEQQAEMLTKKSKKVANRIVSVHKPYIRPIIKWKKWKPIEVWAKVQIWLIWGKVAMVTQHDWDNVHDSKTVKKWIEVFQEIRWKKPKEAWYDKWYRAKDTNDPYLSAQWIANWIQWSTLWKEQSKTSRKRQYNRRASVEPKINDIKNHRGLNKNLLKKENAKQGLIWGLMASNYICGYL